MVFFFFPGTDGWIKIWYYETIDQAEATEDNNTIEIEPIYEFLIENKTTNNENSSKSSSSMLMQILKKYPNDLSDNFWYAQVITFFLSTLINNFSTLVHECKKKENFFLIIIK